MPRKKDVSACKRVFISVLSVGQKGKNHAPKIPCTHPPKKRLSPPKRSPPTHPLARRALSVASDLRRAPTPSPRPVLRSRPCGPLLRPFRCSSAGRAAPSVRSAVRADGRAGLVRVSPPLAPCPSVSAGGSSALAGFLRPPLRRPSAALAAAPRSLAPPARGPKKARRASIGNHSIIIIIGRNIELSKEYYYIANEFQQKTAPKAEKTNRKKEN